MLPLQYIGERFWQKHEEFEGMEHLIDITI